MYKLEEDLFISEINKIANNYIADIESKIYDINSIIEKIKNEQNLIVENNKILNEYFNMFYEISNDTNNSVNYEEFVANKQIPEIEKINFSTDIKKWNNIKNNFKFNYFTSQAINNITANNNSDTIFSSKVFFDDKNLKNFVNELKYSKKENLENNENNDNEQSDLKNFLFDEKTVNAFSIKNWNSTALIQVNLDLKKNGGKLNDNINYNNIKCYLSISNNEIKNYLELGKKMFSDGNICLYDLLPWDKFNIFGYSNLSFKILIFNHYK
jgi:hypothetical protein